MFKCVCNNDQWCDDDRCCQHLSIVKKFEYPPIDQPEDKCIQKQILDALKSGEFQSGNRDEHYVFDVIDNPLYYTDIGEILSGVYDSLAPMIIQTLLKRNIMRMTRMMNMMRMRKTAMIMEKHSPLKMIVW